MTAIAVGLALGLLLVFLVFRFGFLLSPLIDWMVERWW